MHRHSCWPGAVLLFLLMAGSSGAQTPDSLSAGILALHEEKFRWMMERDTGRLGALVADDVVYVHSNGWHEHREEMMHNIGSGRLRYHDVQVQEARVRSYGDTRVVNGRGRFEVSLEDNHWILILDYTEVYILSDEGWKLVSRHACRVPEP